MVVALRVAARSSRDAVEGIDAEGAIRVRVTAAPVGGAANTAVVRLLAATLGLPRGSLSIVSGANSRHKRLRIDGLAAADVLARWPGASVGRP